MKKIISKFTIYFTILIFLNNCQSNNMKKINETIKNVRTQFAPDKRVAIFNIEFIKEDSKSILRGETDKPEALKFLVDELKKNEIEVVNEVNVLPDSSLGEKIFGIINLSVANIRSKPEHPAELATQGLLGTAVNILKMEDGWYLIQTPDKYISWVDDDGIYSVDENELNNWKNSERVIVTKNYSNAYEEASEKSDKVSDLVLGDILKFVESKNNFTKIEFPDSRIAFIKSSDVKSYNTWSGDSIATNERIVNSAKEFLGLPYLWGGTSSKGVDCSGFTKTVYFMNGVILPRDASQQVNVGELVGTKDNFSNLVPGDLLFFGRKKSDTEKEKVTHVALYIGDGNYIHSSGRVRYNSLDKDATDFNQYRFNTFIRAKRIIGSYDKGENLVKNNEFYN